MRILIVEDNRNLARGVRHNLALDGHEVQLAYTGSDGLARARAEPAVDLILLDLMIPKPDGFEVLGTLRAEGVEVPVIVLTARGAEDDLVRALRLGADDYITKPFSILELLARVDAVRRRATRSRRGSDETDGPLVFRDVHIDPSTRVVTRANRPIALRPKEYELLLALAHRRGHVASREELLAAVWGYGQGVVSRTVDTHIRLLRQKLEDDADAPELIVTVRKAGYRLAG